MSGLDYFDSVLIALITGVCTINLLLFIFYMISRMSEKNDVTARSRSAQNKADRPFWVFGCLISGTIWMVASVLLSGNFNIYYGGTSQNLCIILKVVLQYTFGYILWINLIIYRLCRLFMVHAWTVKPLHAMIVLSILQTPFIVYSIADLSADSNCGSRSDMESYSTCVPSMNWSIALYTMSFLYLILFVYLTVKVSKITGTFKDLKRYISFCGLSFLFLIFDASLYLTENWSLVTLRRLLCFFVFCIVTAQSWSIFWSVLIRKRVKKPKDSGSTGDGSVMVLDEKSVKVGPPEFDEDELMGAPIRRTNSVNPNQYDTEHFSVRQGIFLPAKPRESINEFYIPELYVFSEYLTSEDVDRLETSEEYLNSIRNNSNSNIETDDVNNSFDALNQELSSDKIA